MTTIIAAVSIFCTAILALVFICLLRYWRCCCWKYRLFTDGITCCGCSCLVRPPCDSPCDGVVLLDTTDRHIVPPREPRSAKKLIKHQTMIANDMKRMGILSGNEVRRLSAAKNMKELRENQAILMS